MTVPPPARPAMPFYRPSKPSIRPFQSASLPPSGCLVGQTGHDAQRHRTSTNHQRRWRPPRRAHPSSQVVDRTSRQQRLFSNCQMGGVTWHRQAWATVRSQGSPYPEREVTCWYEDTTYLPEVKYTPPPSLSHDMCVRLGRTHDLRASKSRSRPVRPTAALDGRLS